jgi:hypothetical protein
LVLLAAGCGGKGEERAAATKAQDKPKPPAAPISLTPEPIVVDGHTLDGTIRPRAAAGVIVGEDDRARAAFAITGPGSGWWVAWDDLSVLAVPDRTWMARRCDGREIDPKAGELTVALVAATAGPFLDHDQCVPVLPPAEDFPRPLAALGAGAERSIILIRETMDPGSQTLYDVAKSTDGGKTWALEGGPPDVRTHSLADVHVDRVHGTVDVLLRAHQGDQEVMLLLQVDSAQPLAIPQPVPVERFALEGACRKAGVTWWLGADRKVRRAQRSVVTEIATVPETTPADEFQADLIVDCSTDQALVRGADRVLRHGSHVGSDPAFDEGVDTGALLASGKAVGVAARDNVLHVVREGAATAEYTLPGPYTLHGVVVWGDVVRAVVAAGFDAPPELVTISER